MLCYPLTADVPEVAVFIGFILLFTGVHYYFFSESLVWLGKYRRTGVTTDENPLKKEGAGD